MRLPTTSGTFGPTVTVYTPGTPSAVGKSTRQTSWRLLPPGCAVTSTSADGTIREPSGRVITTSSRLKTGPRAGFWFLPTSVLNVIVTDARPPGSGVVAGATLSTRSPSTT